MAQIEAGVLHPLDPSSSIATVVKKALGTEGRHAIFSETAAGLSNVDWAKHSS